MRETFKIINLMDMENFKMLMGIFIKVNGNNHCFTEKAMNLINNFNIKDNIYLDIDKDMEKSYMKMATSIQGN